MTRSSTLFAESSPLHPRRCQFPGPRLPRRRWRAILRRACGVRPDLTALGKVIGGGLPVGAFGGRHEIMDQLSPAGPVYQAGTLSGNPLAMSAGLAQLPSSSV